MNLALTTTDMLLFVLPLALFALWLGRRVLVERRALKNALSAADEKFRAHAAYRTQVSAAIAALQRATSLDELARVFMTHTTRIINAHYGALYLHDADSGCYVRVGSYGANASLPQAFAPGEGLVGQCALDSQPLIIYPLPVTPIRIDSALGHSAPKQLALQAIVQNDHVVGVLELAALTAFNAQAADYLDEMMPTLAMGIEIINRSTHTQDLLEASNRQASQLEQQQAELQESFAHRDAANQALQQQVQELASARRAMLNIMEDLEQTRVAAETGATEKVGDGGMESLFGTASGVSQ